MDTYLVLFSSLFFLLRILFAVTDGCVGLQPAGSLPLWTGQRGCSGHEAVARSAQGLADAACGPSGRGAWA